MDHGNEFSAEPVAADQLVSWPRVAAVAVMVSFSLPTFITGLEIAGGLSGQQTIAAFLLGSFIVLIVGGVMGALGAGTRLSSYLLVRLAFGDTGARIVNLAFAVSLLGWFGVNINLFTDAVGALSEELFGVKPSTLLLAVIASVCMTFTTLVGFRAINVLSVLLVPVLAIVTVLLFTAGVEERSLGDLIAIDVEQRLTVGEGVSAIVGAIIIGAIILPDITRFARHWSGAVYTAFWAYMIVQVFVMASAAVAGRALGMEDILEILLAVNLGFGAFAIVIAGSWVLNSLNLYSTVLSVKASFPALPAVATTLILGAVGVLAALMNILDAFITFLFYLSVVFIPVAGVIIIDYLLVHRSRYHIHTLAANQAWNVKGFIAWTVGALFAIATSVGLLPSVSGIAAIDAVLLTSTVYVLISWRDREPVGEASCE